MSSLLYALGRRAFRARLLVAGIWVAVLAVLVTGAVLLSTGTDNTYSIPGTESQNALDALARTFPEVSGTSAQLIAVVPPGTGARDPEVEAAVTATIGDLAAIPQVSSVASPYDDPDSPNVSPDASAVLVPIQLAVTTTAVTPDTSAALQQAGADLQEALPAGAQVAVGGQLFAQDPAGIGVTELLGIVVAFVVLLVTFGALAAAGLPLATALGGVAASLALVLAATPLTTITSTTPLLALMLGLAVGIDYALFIVARHQEQLRRGNEPEEAAARAVATSGSAVVFAAGTVIIALLGIAVAGIPFLTVMGVAASLAVAVAVAISLTLTPALLGFIGWHAVGRRHRPVRRAPDTAAATVTGPDPGGPASGAEPGEEDAVAAEDSAVEDIGDDAPVARVLTGQDAPVPAEIADRVAAELARSDPPQRAATPRPSGFFVGWVRTATRWPLVTIVLIGGALAVAAVPAAHLRLALPDAGTLEEDAPARITFDLVAEHFGPGYNGPLLVTGTVIESDDPVGLMDDVGAALAAVPGVASVPLATPNASGDTGIVQVIPTGGPDSTETKDLVRDLRAMHDELQAQFGVDLSVTGYTAAGIDISDRLADALVPFGVLVVGLSLVLLAMVFRSIVVPVTAAAGYALSIGAALGLTTLVFVDGVLAEPLDVAGVGAVISFMPIILMGVLFGLAMDYEVFLVSRMREDFVHHGDPVRAVDEGFVASARVVTAAATIMFAVFVAFVPAGDASIQPIAFGLAVGVAIDAFLVRMTLIPAVLRLFGRAAWWIPRRLDRVLPRFDVEGEGVASELALADWPDDGTRPVIAAERAEIPGAGTFDALASAGEALVVHGADAEARTAVLLTLCGRRPVRSGRLKVAGFVLPARTGAVRRRSAYVRFSPDDGAVAMLADAFTPRPEVLVLDGLDDVVEPDRRTEIARIVAATMFWSRPPTVVVSVREPSVAVGLLPTGVPRRALAVVAVAAEV